ncbi:MAG: STAS domain-containing protein [Actinobacteria bacterium]|nr:STAS domain-containing protein [Actinomycetota bacterium]
MTALNVRTSDRPDRIDIEVAGELDLATAPKLEEELQHVETMRPSLVVIDLRPLDFMDSSGLRCLLAADMRARERGCRLVLIRGRERVQRVFGITRLDEQLEFVDGEDDATLIGADQGRRSARR